MPTAKSPVSDIPWQQVCTHWEGWGKIHGHSSACHIAVPLERVVANFEPYWTDFLEREAEDDPLLPPLGVYAQLKASGYPSLERVLAHHPTLFSALVMQGLQTEFVGFVLNSPEDLRSSSPTYFLHSLSYVSVSGTSVVIEGGCSVIDAPGDLSRGSHKSSKRR